MIMDYGIKVQTMSNHISPYIIHPIRDLKRIKLKGIFMKLADLAHKKVNYGNGYFKLHDNATYLCST